MSGVRPKWITRRHPAVAPLHLAEYRTRGIGRSYTHSMFKPAPLKLSDLASLRGIQTEETRVAASRKWTLAFLAFLSACGSDDGGSAQESTSLTGETTQSTTATSTSSTTSEVATTTTSNVPVSSTTSAVAAAQGGCTKLPNMVGQDLQLAQDTMQASGFYSLSSHDATGQGRSQVLDRNWTVVDQATSRRVVRDGRAEHRFRSSKR